MDYQTWLGDVESVSKWFGVLLVFAGLWQFLVKPLIKFAKAVNQTTQRLSESLPTLLKIAEQFKPNGGNSLRDVVDDIRNGLALSSQRHRAIYSYLDLCFFETDSKGLYIFVSKDWCETTGLYPDQAVGDGWINAVHPDDREKVMTEWRRAVIEKREFALEYRLSCVREQKVARVYARAFPAKNSNGMNEAVVGIVGILRRLPTADHETSKVVIV